MDDDDEAGRVIHSGILLKKGSHPRDKYYRRFVCLWSKRLGYSLSPTTNVICHFLPLSEVISASPMDTSTSDFYHECDFVVHVRPKSAGTKDTDLAAEVTMSRTGSNVTDGSDRSPTSPKVQRKRSLVGFFGFSTRPGNVPYHSYYLRASGIAERNMWMAAINQAVSDLQAELEHDRYRENHFLLRNQIKLRNIYTSFSFQMVTAFMVGMNFLVMLVESQTREFVPSDDADGGADRTGSNDAFFSMAEIVFTSLFATELLINLLAFWFVPFVMQPWNWFDMMVIAASLWGITQNGGGALNVLRLFRALRAFKLVKKMASMRKILISLGACVRPVLSAFFLLLVLASIYAQIGYIFWGAFRPSWFGCYSAALISLVQILTFDGWMDHIGRDMIDSSDQNSAKVAIALYLVSWAFLAGFIMMNIVLAVLVDSFTAAQESMKKELEDAIERKRMFSPPANPLERLTTQWATIRSREELDKHLETSFTNLDCDESGRVELWELQRFLWIKFGTRLSDEKFNDITLDRAFCDEEGRLDLGGFKAMARHLLSLQPECQTMANSSTTWKFRKWLPASFFVSEADDSRADVIFDGGEDFSLSKVVDDELPRKDTSVLSMLADIRGTMDTMMGKIDGLGNRLNVLEAAKKEEAGISLHLSSIELRRMDETACQEGQANGHAPPKKVKKEIPEVPPVNGDDDSADGFIKAVRAKIQSIQERLGPADIENPGSAFGNELQHHKSQPSLLLSHRSDRTRASSEPL